MGLHEDYPEWSRRVHFAAARLAEMDGHSPLAYYRDPKTGEVLMAGFTYMDAYLPEAVALMGYPTKELALRTARRVAEARKERDARAERARRGYLPPS